MKHFIRTSIVSALMLIVFSNLGWGQLLTEDFNYSGLLNANGWTTHSGAGTNAITTIGITGLTYSGYVGSGIGNAATMKTNGEDVNKAFTSQNNGTVYAAFMVNISASQTAGDYFFHFCQTSGASAAGFYGRVWIKKDASTTNFAFGLSKTSNSPVYTGYSYSVGTTYLVVVKYTFISGTTNDQVDLFVNPVINGTEPSATLTSTDGATGTDATALTCVALRQGTASSAPTLVIDGIRVGTSWTSVVPASISAPTTQASNIIFSSISSNSITASWTNGDGAKRIAILNNSSTFTDPTNGTDPTANNVYGGTGQQVVYNGNASTVNVTGLSENTTYWLRVYEANGSGSSIKFLTTTATNNPNSQITPYSVPSTQTTLITFPNVQTSQISISWTNGTGYKRAVFMKELSGAITNPTDGITYTASSDWSSKGTQLGTNSGYYCIFNDVGTEVTVTNLKPGTLYVIQSFEYNGSSTGTVYNTSTATGNPNSQATLSETPTLIANPTSLSGFTTDYGTVSGNQTYAISGSALTPPDGNITLTAPSNFEISTDGSTYTTSTIDIPYSAGTLGSTTVYVRIASNPTTGSISGLVTNDGGGIPSTVKVNVSGFVYFAAPTTQPSNLIFSNVTSSSLDLGWTAGNGTNTIVLVKSGSAVNSNPVKGTSYNANTIFGTGDQIGTGNYVVYNGTGTSVSITGLNPNTTYYFALYSFNGSGTTVNYLTTSPATGNQVTNAPPATTYTWVGATSDWSLATNWSPNRTTPATNDIIQINTGGAVTLTGFTTQTIGQLIISNNTTVGITPASTATMTISGGTGTDFSIEAGSQFNVTGATVFTLALQTGTTASIFGSYTVSGAAHKFTAADASGIVFGNGSIFTTSTGFSSNAFGTGTNGSVIFSNGSTYVHGAGSSPFGGSSNSIVVFQTGSLFKLKSNLTPSLSGRTYSNFEADDATINLINMTGSSPLTLDNLAITNGTLFFNLTGGINIKGNITVSSGGSLNFAPATTNTITLNGNTNQTITNSGTLTFSSGTSVSINNAGGISLGGNVSLGGNLIVNAGLIKTLGYTLSVDGNLTVTSPDNTKMVVLDDGTNLGTLKLKVSTNAGYTFPVGDTRSGANFTPATVTFTGTTFSSSYLSLSMNAQKESHNSSSTDYITRNWLFTPSTGFSNLGYTISLKYTDADVNGTESNIWFAKYDVGSWALLNQPDINTNTFTSQATLTSFSTFTGGEQGVLPVKLSSFSSSVERRNITLAWSTASETNNSGFDIERRNVNDNNWVKTGYMQGKGTTNNLSNYSFTDRGLQTGKYKYRLKQIDYNGNYNYYELNSIAEIGVPEKYNISQNYPNPFNPITKIDIDIPFDSKVSLKLYDITGREIKSVLNSDLKAGYYTQLFDASSLSSGVYFYRVAMSSAKGNFAMSKKMMVIK